MVPYQQTRVLQSEVSPIHQHYHHNLLTVVIPIKNDRPCSMAIDLASARPIETNEHTVTSSSTSCRRLTRSPRGEMARLPIACPAWARVGMTATFSLDAPKSLAILHYIKLEPLFARSDIRDEHRLDVSFDRNIGDLLDSSRGSR